MLRQSYMQKDAIRSSTLEKSVKTEQTDHELIIQTVNGDNRSFETLVERYHLQLYNFIYRSLHDTELSNDVLQFVFLQLYLSLPKLQHNLSSNRTSTPLKAWLFQVAWNRCIDELRKKRSLLFSELEHEGENEEISLVHVIPDADPLPEDIAEQHELRDALREAIHHLPPRFRAVVFLRYTYEMSFGEIGRILGMPENTAKTYFQRARPLLRAELTQR
jgi:RNA polymerase sigma factor (sigma-70 family)